MDSDYSTALGKLGATSPRRVFDPGCGVEPLRGRVPVEADREIDQLVYELYGLTDKEIALVEEVGR